MTYTAPLNGNTEVRKCVFLGCFVRVSRTCLPLINVSLVPYQPSISTQHDDDNLIFLCQSHSSRQAVIKKYYKLGF